MKIQINGQHMSVGENLNKHVTSRINEVVNRFFSNPIMATIHFIKTNHHYETEILVNEGSSRHSIFKSNASNDDAYSSFDYALSRMEKQLRKYKDKISHHKNNSSTADAVVSISGMKYIISPAQINHDQSAALEEANGDEHDNPAIIAEKPVEIHTSTVNDAVMRMDLEHLEALLFINSKTSRINLVYYRKDGNISWVDTKEL